MVRIVAAFAMSAALGCLGAYEPLPEPLCGNGLVDAGEQCDDANDAKGDGCEADCTYSGALLWSTEYDEGRGASEVQTDVAIDSTGHIYVTGYPQDRTDGKWLQRYTPDGKLLWIFELPIDSDEFTISGLTVDSADRAVLAGTRFAHAAFVMSVAPDAELFWLRDSDAEASTSDRFGDVVARSGMLYTAGTTNFFEGDMFVSSAIDVLTLSEDGEVVHRFSYAPESDEEFADYQAFPSVNGVAVATDGTILVAGSYVHLEAEGNSRALLAAFEPSGALRWEDRHPVPYGSTWFESVRVDAQGQIVALAETIDTELALPGDNYDRVVRKYDASGKLLWTTSYDDGRRGDDYANGVAIDSRSNILTVGTSFRQAWLRKTGPDGDTFWTHSLGGDALEAAFAVAVNPDDSVVVVGHFYHSPAEGSNGWIAKFTP